MTHAILHPGHFAVLTGFAHSNVLLALDYDGTLAPLTSSPEAAVMRPETRRLLTEVARLYPCIVISGRSLDDLATRLDGIPLWFLFGNHGIEPTRVDASHAHTVREWVDLLQERLPSDLGVTLEDKVHSITLHYRHAPDKHRALEAIDAAVSDLRDARALGGADAVSVLPAGGADKGQALQQARQQFACDTAIYVGDDGTDETAFESDSSSRLLAIRIGAASHSRARYHLNSQEEMDEFLRALIDARSSGAGGRATEAGRARGVSGGG